MQRQVRTEDIIGASLDSLKASLYITMLGSVVSYDPTTRTASVQPMQNDPRSNVTTDEVVPEPWPVLQHVPVAWPRAGGFMIVGTLSAGDGVTLQAFDLDPTAVLQQGRSQSPVNVGYVRRLSGNFWRAVPDDIVSPTTDTPGEGVTIVGVDGDAAQIRISNGSIQLGSTGGDHVALATKTLQELTNISVSMSQIVTAFAALSVTITPYSPSGAGVGSTLISAQ